MNLYGRAILLGDLYGRQKRERQRKIVWGEDQSALFTMDRLIVRGGCFGGCGTCSCLFLSLLSLPRSGAFCTITVGEKKSSDLRTARIRCIDWAVHCNYVDFGSDGSPCTVLSPMVPPMDTVWNCVLFFFLFVLFALAYHQNGANTATTI